MYTSEAMTPKYKQANNVGTMTATPNLKSMSLKKFCKRVGRAYGVKVVGEFESKSGFRFSVCRGQPPAFVRQIPVASTKLRLNKVRLELSAPL